MTLQHSPGANHDPAATGDPPVTVRTFARADERMPVRAFLEAEGLRVVHPDGHVLSIDPGLYVAMGFYKLQVPRSQVEQARELLAAWDAAELVDEPFSEDDDASGPPASNHAPSTRRWAWLWLAVLVVALALAVSAR